MRQLSGKSCRQKHLHGQFQNAVNEGADILPEIPTQLAGFLERADQTGFQNAGKCPLATSKTCSCFYRFDDLNAELPDSGSLFCGDEGQA